MGDIVFLHERAPVPGPGLVLGSRVLGPGRVRLLLLLLVLVLLLLGSGYRVSGTGPGYPVPWPGFRVSTFGGGCCLQVPVTGTRVPGSAGGGLPGDYKREKRYYSCMQVYVMQGVCACVLVC